ncbi:Lrp/AsnC family transcriptional regulator [Candidatus Pacearchaeota archaeon]|nr:Lrp/AsnC family transcriptional regulator [Candidatus Pacearchaeota archaeon]
MTLISEKSQEKLKLDLYDKKLIFYLSQDSRTPLNRLAHYLSISPQRTHYKIQRLLDSILDPAPFFNYPLLGIPSYIIFTGHLSSDTVKKLIEESGEIYFLMQALGKYNSVLNVVTKDIERFCSTYLPDQILEIYPIMHSYADDYNPFSLNISPQPLMGDKPLPLAKKDYILLEYLGRFPLEPIQTIHEKTKIDVKTIKKKIGLYKKSNIIQKFRYGVNIFKMGFFVYTLKIDVSYVKKKEILKYLRSNNYSGFVFETHSGFIMHFLPPSHNEVFLFIEGLYKIEPNAAVETVQNTEIFRISMVPKSALDYFKSRSV